MTPFGSLCDDFGVCVYLNTKMEMPARREAVLHFFESLQKTFKEMTDFDRRDNGDYNLEGDRDSGSSTSIRRTSRTSTSPTNACWKRRPSTSTSARLMPRRST